MAVKEREELVEALGRAEAALREATERASALPGDAGGAWAALRELAEEHHVSAQAVEAFVEAVGELLGDRPLTVEVARRAAMLAAAGQVWENELGPLLTSAQVRELLDGVSRQRVDELLRAKRLIALRTGAGRWQFPAFQFHDRRPLDALIAAFWAVAEATASAWTAASWCVSPDEALDGQSPTQWARAGGDSQRLARIARQDAARLAQ
jgi:hypothetical protein